jgi:hypothetical protein
VQTYRVPRVDQAEIRVEQTDRAPLALDLDLDGLFAQQRDDDTDILFHIREPDCAKPHRSTAGKTGADAKINPPPGQLVERGEGVNRHRGDPIGWD